MTGLEANCSRAFYTKKIILLNYLAESGNLVIVVQLTYVFAIERLNACVKMSYYATLIRRNTGAADV